MDPGAILSAPASSPSLIGTPWVLWASLACAAVGGGGFALRTVFSRRRPRSIGPAWETVAGETGLLLAHRKSSEAASSASPRNRKATAASTPLAVGLPFLCGVYRGRAVEAGVTTRGQIRVAVRIANPLHLFDEFALTSPLPEAPWLSTVCRDGLTRLTEGNGAGSVSVHDHLLVLLVSGEADRTGTDPAQLRSLLDFGCDLAENADRVGTATTDSHHRVT